MAARSPVTPPIASDDDAALAFDGPLVSQQDDNEGNNRKDLWKEGQPHRQLRQRQLSLHEEEYRKPSSTVSFDGQHTDSAPESSIVDHDETFVKTIDHNDRNWDEIDWDGEFHPLTVRAWGEFKSKHSFEHAFQPLRGTHAARFAKAVQNKEKSLKKTKKLCRAVAMASNKRHEEPSEAHRFVDEGLEEIVRYEERRAACPSKHEIETHFTTVWVSGKEVKVKLILLDFEPFLGHLPGDYLMRHVDVNNQDYLMWDAELNSQDELVTEGVVPHTRDEYVDRLVGDVVPAILDMVIAFVAFDPFDANRMPQWCTQLRKKSISALTADDMEKVHTMWEQKFMDFQTLPSVLELQCSDSESRFCEAAWLLEEVERLGVVYPWSDGFRQLLQEATGQFASDLGRRYTGNVLHREALECIEDEATDRVLAYQLSPFTQKSDIHDFYQGHGASINEHAPSLQRLADIRNAARNLLSRRLPGLRIEAADTHRRYDRRTAAQHSSDTRDDDPSDDWHTTAHFEPQSSVRVHFGGKTAIKKKVTLQLPAQPGTTPDTIIVVPSAQPVATASTTTSNKRKRTDTTIEASSSPPEPHSTSSSSLEPPLPSEQPAPVKRRRGRPKKQDGDPKSPYRRKKPVSERAPTKRQRLEKDKTVKDSN